MSGKKQIKKEDWADRMVTFTNGNKGRNTSVVQEEGKLAENLPFMAIDFDPVKKGDDLVISLGEDTLVFSHTIENPKELYEIHNDLGVVTSMEIIDQANKKVILLFS